MHLSGRVSDHDFAELGMDLENPVEHRDNCLANHVGNAACSRLANRDGMGAVCHLQVVGRLEIV